MDRVYKKSPTKIVIYLLLICCCPAVVKANNISSELTLTNRYQFRGLTQSADSPAIQGAIDIRWPNNLYAGTWGSWVLEGEQGDKELNYYFGGLLELNNILWNAGYIYYDYRDPAENGFRQEVYVIGYWQNIRGSFYQDLNGIPTTYWELYSRWKGPLSGDLYFSFGRQAFQPNTFLPYTNYVFGWERLWQDRWSLSIYYTDTQGLITNPSNISLAFKWYLEPGRHNDVWQR